MADYVSILAKAIGGLAENTAENRQLIYQKARGAIDRKLRAMDPVPSEAAIGEQMTQLEAAINQVEGEHQLAGIQAPEEPAPVSSPAPSPAPVPQEPVAEAAPAAPVVSGEAVIPAPNPPAGFIDDVILIDGIGEKTRSLLEAEGITGLSQVAAMSDDALAATAAKIGFPDFEKNQQWKEQAADMLSGKLPRSKTDQERLKKLMEEAAPAQETQRAEVAAPVVEPAPEPAPEPIPEPVPEAAVVAEEPSRPAAEVPPASPAPEPIVPEPVSEPIGVVAPTEDERAIADAIRALSADDEQSVPPVAPTQPSQTAAATPAAADPFLAQPQGEPARVAPVQAQPSPTAAPASPTAETPPPYVSELEGDPMAAGHPDSYTPPGSVDLGKKKSGAGKAIGCVAILALLGGAGYAAWANQDLVKPYFDKAVTAVQALIGGPEDTPAGNTAASDSEQATDSGTSGDGSDAQTNSSKDTSRLGSGATNENTSGDSGADTNSGESNAGSDEANATSGEGAGNESETAPRSIIDNPIENTEPSATVEVEGGSETDTAASGETAEPDASGGQPAAESVTPAIINGEKAFLYEEAIGATGASRDEGGIVWSLANEAPEEGASPEAVIKGVMEIPARGLTMNLSIKRNVDPGLPASHLIELFFTAQSQFSGGNIDNVSRFVMKATEQARGESLVGVPARIDTGFFLIALNNLDQAQKSNLNLLANSEWIDIPVAYVTGRRALMTFEKGESGRKVFADAIADWRNR